MKTDIDRIKQTKLKDLPAFNPEGNDYELTWASLIVLVKWVLPIWIAAHILLWLALKYSEQIDKITSH